MVLPNSSIWLYFSLVPYCSLILQHYTFLLRFALNWDCIRFIENCISFSVWFVRFSIYYCFRFCCCHCCCFCSSILSLFLLFSSSGLCRRCWSAKRKFTTFCLCSAFSFSLFLSVQFVCLPVKMYLQTICIFFFTLLLFRLLPQNPDGIILVCTIVVLGYENVQCFKLTHLQS